jgi:glycosyltransferase involved in cell wall biosynthesis
LVSVGSLQIHKNHRYLLEVLAEANRRGSRFTLDLIGDGPLRHDLESLSRRLGVSSQVRFWGCRSDVRDILPGHRLYVHSAISEVLPMAIIEALAAGLPVLAGFSGGIPEILCTGAGVVWPLTDPAAAAARLIELLEDGDRLAAVAAAAVEVFHRRFDAAVAGDQLWHGLNQMTAIPAPDLGAPFGSGSAEFGRRRGRRSSTGLANPLMPGA